MKDTKKALVWIIKLLEENNLNYQVVGGLAAKAYGSTRELADIDIYVPKKDFIKICELTKEFITWGPGHYKSNSWDLEYVKIERFGQKIEIANSNNTKWFDALNKKWVVENSDYDKAQIKTVFGVSFKVMSKENLIFYKKRLNREVDLIDIEEITS